jgi:hypothetical protein
LRIFEAARRPFAAFVALSFARAALGQTPQSYEEKKDGATTTVTFKADAVSGIGLGSDSIRVLIHSKRSDVKCLGQYDYVTDRELTGLTLRYAFRATLKCMNPCFTDDDLDFLTSCDDWDGRAERIRTLRHAIGPLREKDGATEREVAEQLLSETAGCNEMQLDRARKDGRISERVFEAGQCRQYNDTFKSREPVAPRPLTLPPTSPLLDADLEFSRFRTTLSATFLTNKELNTDTRFGGALALRWHFAGPYNVQAYAGAIGDSPVLGLGFFRSPSRHRYTVSGGALLIDKSVQRLSVTGGEVGLGIPTRRGSVQLLGSPISYYRDFVNDLAGAETHVKIAVEHQFSPHLLVFAHGRAGFLFAGGRTGERAVTEGTQDALGSRLMAAAGLTVPFRDSGDPQPRFIPSLRLEASYESQRNAVSPTSLQPSPRADYDAWTLAAGVAGGF